VDEFDMVRFLCVTVLNLEDDADEEDSSLSGAAECERFEGGGTSGDTACLFLFRSVANDELL
jgi:hypothetical protein